MLGARPWLATFVLFPWLEVAQGIGAGVREIPSSTGSLEIVAVPAFGLV